MSKEPRGNLLDGPGQGPDSSQIESYEKESQDGLEPGLFSVKPSIPKGDINLYRGLLVRSKVSENVFQKICELFPDLLNDVLDEAQVPPSSRSSFRSPRGGSLKLARRNRDIETERFVRSATLRTASNCSKREGFTVASDEGGEQAGKTACKNESEIEYKTDSCTSFSGVDEDAGDVHQVASLKDLFSEDSDFVSAKASFAVVQTPENKGLSATQNQGTFERGSTADHSPKIQLSSRTRAFATEKEGHVVADEEKVKSNFSDKSQLLTAVSLNGQHEDFSLPADQSVKSSGTIETKTTPGANPQKPFFRRPLASRRKGVVNIPFLRKDELDRQQHTKDEDPASGNFNEAEGIEKTERTPPEQPQVRVTETPKGVIMRGFTNYKQVRGIRRAETGQIMSREELALAGAANLTTNPVPKSFRQPLCLDDYEDSPSLMPSSFQPASRKSISRQIPTLGSPDRQKREKQIEELFSLSPAHRDEVSSGKLRNLFKFTPVKINEERKSVGKKTLPFSLMEQSISPNSGGLSNLFALSPHSRKEPVREEHSTNSKFSEAGDSSGMLGRFGNKIRRGTHVVSRNQAAEALSDGRICTIVTPGSIDETVSKVSVFCRKI